MAELTEQQIFDRMCGAFAAAIQCCDNLVRYPAKGPTYARLRDELSLIEGCCRQASVWREDTRWLPIGMLMADVHKRAGNWLRAKQPSVLYGKLGDLLRKTQLVAEMLRTQATGRTGMILPEPLPLHRETRPSRVMLPPGMQLSQGGVILP